MVNHDAESSVFRYSHRNAQLSAWTAHPYSTFYLPRDTKMSMAK